MSNNNGHKRVDTDRVINSLRNELDAARKKLHEAMKGTDGAVTASIVGYIEGIQIAMVVVSKC